MASWLGSSLASKGANDSVRAEQYGTFGTMSSYPFALSVDPSPESVNAVRQLVAERVRGGAAKADLAREAGLEARTFAAVIDNPARVPRGATWLALRDWYFAQFGRGVAQGQRVAEQAPVYGAPESVESVVAAGQREMSRWVREFAARLLEASAAAVRTMPDEADVSPPVSRATLDETARRQLEEDAAAARRRRGTG